MIPTPTLPITPAKALCWLSDMYTLGLAYHPDDAATTVGNRAPDGSWKPLFTPDDAATANRIMGRARAVLGEAVYTLRPDLWWKVVSSHMAITRATPDMGIIGLAEAEPDQVRAALGDTPEVSRYIANR